MVLLYDVSARTFWQACVVRIGVRKGENTRWNDLSFLRSLLRHMIHPVYHQFMSSKGLYVATFFKSRAYNAHHSCNLYSSISAITYKFIVTIFVSPPTFSAMTTNELYRRSQSEQDPPGLHSSNVFKFCRKRQFAEDPELKQKLLCGHITNADMDFFRFLANQNYHIRRIIGIN